MPQCKSTPNNKSKIQKKSRDGTELIGEGKTDSKGTGGEENDATTWYGQETGPSVESDRGMGGGGDVDGYR